MIIAVPNYFYNVHSMSFLVSNFYDQLKLPVESPDYSLFINDSCQSICPWVGCQQDIIRSEYIMKHVIITLIHTISKQLKDRFKIPEQHAWWILEEITKKSKSQLLENETIEFKFLFGIVSSEE